MVIFFKYYFPALFWAATIFFVSSLKSAALPGIAFQVDDFILHFIEYAIFGFLLALAFMHSPVKPHWKYLLVVAGVGILYGASDEFHQSFVEGRYAELSDFIADSIGAVCGMMLFALLFRLKKQPTQ